MAEENVVELTPKATKEKPAPQAPNAPAKSRRGRKPGVEAKVRPPLPANAFRIRKLTTEQSRANVKRKRVERSDQQRIVDQMVYEVWKEWVEAGEPMNWVDMPISEWPIPKNSYEDGMFMLTKACNLYGRKPIYGDIREEMYEGELCMIVPFCIITRPPKRQQRIESNGGQ